MTVEMTDSKIQAESKIVAFLKEVAITAKDKVVDFVKGFVRHIESVAVLTLSSVGLSSILGEFPYWLALPAWVEAPLVIPVVSVLTIAGLMKIAEKRAKSRVTA